jgi:hypothetical protein
MIARPTIKTDLLNAAKDDYSEDEKKKEARWKRDKNLRDVLIHLYEWQCSF